MKRTNLGLLCLRNYQIQCKSYNSCTWYDHFSSNAEAGWTHEGQWWGCVKIRLRHNELYFWWGGEGSGQRLQTKNLKCTLLGLVSDYQTGCNTCKKGSISSSCSWTEKSGLISLSSMLLGWSSLGCCCWMDLGSKVVAAGKRNSGLRFSNLPSIPLKVAWQWQSGY